jgi:hypothetical protein
MKEYDLSDRKLKFAVLLAVAIIGWFCFKGASSAHAQATPANLSPGVQEVVKLSQAHMSDDVILSYIRNSGVSYRLTADDILYLNGQGVSQPILSALLKAAPDTASAPAPTPTAAPPVSVPPPPAFSQPATPAPAVAVPPSAPLPGSEVTLSYFQTQLAPYGGWVDVPGYGLCWRPTVQDSEVGWRPYFNGGHWDYTDDGWFWRSDYPWGEYAFHYGRWARDARYGWVWTPGYEWAPAWVSWRYCEDPHYGWCGWAPLPPGARFQAGVGILWKGGVAVDADFGLGPDAFAFIPFENFWDHDYRPFLAPSEAVRRDIFHLTFVVNGYRFVGGHFVIDGIGRDRIGVLTHHKVVAASIDFHDARIARARELERAHALEVIGGHGPGAGFRGDGRRDDHH